MFDETGHGGDGLALEFISFNLQDRNKRKYPQRPLTQSHQVEYPILAYKNFTPDNKQVCIVNLATGTQKVYDLGEFEFQSFVTHTQKVDQKLFHRKTETSTSVMMLVQRGGMTQLMCIKSKPWDFDNEDHIYMFNAILPNHERVCRGLGIKDVQARRFTSDKMCSV